MADGGDKVNAATIHRTMVSWTMVSISCDEFYIIVKLKSIQIQRTKRSILDLWALCWQKTEDDCYTVSIKRAYFFVILFLRGLKVFERRNPPLCLSKLETFVGQSNPMFKLVLQSFKPPYWSTYVNRLRVETLKFIKCFCNLNIKTRSKWKRRWQDAFNWPDFNNDIPLTTEMSSCQWQSRWWSAYIRKKLCVCVHCTVPVGRTCREGKRGCEGSGQTGLLLLLAVAVWWCPTALRALPAALSYTVRSGPPDVTPRGRRRRRRRRGRCVSVERPTWRAEGLCSTLPGPTGRRDTVFWLFRSRHAP